MDWKNREDIENAQGAVEAIADLMASFARRPMTQEDLSVLDEAERVAAKWSVPFSKALTIQMVKQIRNQEDGSPWDSSTRRCNGYDDSEEGSDFWSASDRTC